MARKIPSTLNLLTSNRGLVLPQLVDDVSKNFLSYLLKVGIVDVVKNTKAFKYAATAIDWDKSVSLVDNFKKIAQQLRTSLTTTLNGLKSKGGLLNSPFEIAEELLTNPEQLVTNYRSLVPLDEIATSLAGSASSVAAGDSLHTVSGIKESIGRLADAGLLDEVVDSGKGALALDYQHAVNVFQHELSQPGAVVFTNGSLTHATEGLQEAAKNLQALDHLVTTGTIKGASSFELNLIEKIGLFGIAKEAFGGILKSLPVLNLLLASATGDFTYLLSPIAFIFTIIFKERSMPDLQEYFTKDKKTLDIPSSLTKLVADFKSQKWGNGITQRVSDENVLAFNKGIDTLVSYNATLLTSLTKQVLDIASSLQSAFLYTGSVLNSDITSNYYTDNYRKEVGKSFGALENALEAVLEDLLNLDKTVYDPVENNFFRPHNQSTWYYNYLKDISALFHKTWVDLKALGLILADLAETSSTINKRYLAIVNQFNGVLGDLVLAPPSNVIDPTYDKMLNPPGLVLIDPVIEQLLSRLGLGTASVVETISPTVTVTTTTTEPAGKFKFPKRKKRFIKKKNKKNKKPRVITSIDANVASRSEWIKRVQFKFFKPSEITSNGYGRLIITTKTGRSYFMGNFRRGTFAWIVTFGVGTGFGFWSQLPKKRAQLTGATFSAQIRKITKSQRLAAISVEIKTPRIKYK